jgi:hypothetical protein
MEQEKVATMKRLTFAALAATALLAGCATPTPYQPLGARTGVRGGFSEQQIERNRFRVMFAGNQFTSRQRVENYLLFRAAELTVQQGYDGFTLVDRNTDKHTTVQTYARPLSPGPWGYWGPSWRYYGRFGWRYWDPWGYDPFWADTVDVNTIDRFEASAEIVMFKGPPKNARDFDAHEVMRNLGPTIEVPAPPR